jgi:hypothetical protein
MIGRHHGKMTGGTLQVAYSKGRLAFRLRVLARR